MEDGERPEFEGYSPWKYIFITKFTEITFMLSFYSSLKGRI